MVALGHGHQAQDTRLGDQILSCIDHSTVLMYSISPQRFPGISLCFEVALDLFVIPLEASLPPDPLLGFDRRRIMHWILGPKYWKI